MITKFTDKDLGTIFIKRNSRAKRCVARYKGDYIQFTIPAYYNDDQIIDTYYKLKPQITELVKQKKIVYLPQTVFSAATFSVEILEHRVANFYASLNSSILYIVCPQGINFYDTDVQTKIRSYIDTALKREAKRLLPERVEVLAHKFGFQYAQIKINKSKTRWGSCSSTKNINLSYYCFLLPLYLVDFIILHELCHTVEMNHGSKFWKLLDQVTNNQARELTKQLNNYTTYW